MTWTKDSWKNFPQKHIPQYDPILLELSIKQLSSKINLFNINTILELKSALSTLEDDNAIIIQMGECAEAFSQANLTDVKERVNLMNKFTEQAIQNTNKNPIKIGRIAGQYSKPRSTETEIIDKKEIPTYKGDLVHSFENREHPDANRFIESYKYFNKTLIFLKSLQKNIYTSHECLILPYESQFTLEQDSKIFNSSAYMLWLGNRTKFKDSAHIEYLRGIENTVGIKICKEDDPQYIKELIQILNPNNEKGKIVLIFRLGVNAIEEYLPKFLNVLKNTDLNLIYVVDPMHGNTKLLNNYKTRAFEDISQEIILFIRILKEMNVYFGGIHIENTYEDVTECIEQKYIKATDLYQNYQAKCDPRLNKQQTLRLAEIINKELNTK